MQEEARLYHNAEARISYHLGKLGTKIGIKGKLTLYIARHSWATAARDNHISSHFLLMMETKDRIKLLTK